MSRRAKRAGWWVLGVAALLLPMLYGVNRVSGPEGPQIVIGGGPSLIGFGVLLLTLGLGWAAGPFVPLPARSLVRVALTCGALSLILRAMGLANVLPVLAIDIPAAIFGLAAPLCLALAGAKDLRQPIHTGQYATARP